jgi:hypothetical protein
MSSRSLGLALALVAVAPKMPEQCNKVLGPLAGPKASASAEQPPPPPPPPPVSAPTAPPIWTPPDGVTTAAPATATPAAVDAGPPSELALARAASEKKDYKRVKLLLDKKVRSGRGSSEEIQLLRDACERTKDKACLDAIKKLAARPAPADDF